MKYHNVLSAFYTHPWAILESKFLEIEAYLRARASGLRPTKAEQKAMRAGVEAAAPPTRDNSGKVACINVFGTICQRMSMMDSMSGGTSTEHLGRVFDAALASDNIKTIVLNIDSPGGSVYGVQELAQKIFDARDQKKTVAVCNSLCASAAYWIASAAGEMCCTPGGQCGSIGVLAAHEDHSARLDEEGVKTTLIHAGKFKVEGNPYEALDDEAAKHMQSQVDDYYDRFCGAVAKHRGTTAGAVKSGYGQGRVLNAADAVAAGLCDRVASLEDVLGRLGVPTGKQVSLTRQMEMSKNRLKIEAARAG